jgi:predicted restriction endonuclease
MNRTSDHLDRRIGPSDLQKKGDAEDLVDQIGKRFQDGRTELGAKNKANYLAAYRKYVQMVQSNYRGLFPDVKADLAPVANDLSGRDVPPRKGYETHRIVRDTATSREIKRIYEFRCQICKKRLELAPGEFYAEAHHLQPLGGDHRGPDVKENLLCVCPNCHALLDYFAMPIRALKLDRHEINQAYVNYHNSKVRSAAKDRLRVSL